MIATPTTRGQGLRRAGALGAAFGAAALVVGTRDRRLGGLLALAGLALAWSSVRPSNPLLGPVAHQGPRDLPAVALAIAGTPDAGTAAVIEALREEGASATFFVVGSHARRRPELVRAIHRGGHRIANGGLDADPVAFRGPARLVRDLRHTERAVADAIGEDVVQRLYMAPQGVRGPATWAGARRAGYRLVAWSRAVWPDGLADARSAARIAVGGLEPGAVIAIRPAAADRPDGPAAAVRAVCAQARARGLAVAPLDEVTGLVPTGLTSRGPAAEEPVRCP